MPPRSAAADGSALPQLRLQAASPLQGSRATDDPARVLVEDQPVRQLGQHRGRDQSADQLPQVAEGDEPGGVAPVAEAGAIASADCDPSADGRGPVEYKRHLAGVLTVRALRRAVGV